MNNFKCNVNFQVFIFVTKITIILMIIAILFQNVPNIVHCATMKQIATNVLKATIWTLMKNAVVSVSNHQFR